MALLTASLSICCGIFLVLVSIIVLAKLLQRGRCTSKARLDGRTALVTGCNTGIGMETVKDFYKRGARVIMACRDIEKASAAKNSIEKSCQGLQGVGQMVIEKMDLSSLQSVREVARHVLESEARLDLLINNAGVMACPLRRTEDGFEMHFGSNHLGHFLLTLLLLPKLRRSQEARIVTVASAAHVVLLRPMLNDLNWQRHSYNRMQAYALSKTANISFSRELARKLKEHNIDNVTTYSLHPGIIRTELGRHLSGVFTWVYYNLSQLVSKTVWQGAQTTIHCAVDDKCRGQSGLYYSNCRVARAWFYARNDEYARQLWQKSVEMVNLGDYDPFNNTDD